MSGEVPVSDELQAKFDEVFGGGPQEAEPAAGGDRPSGPTPAQRQQAEEEAEELAGMEGATDQDRKGDDFGTDQPGKEEEAGAEKEASASQGKDGDGKDQPGEEPDSTLPAYLRHAAKRAGWEDEQIEGLYKEKPELALQTFERLHSSFTEMGAQFRQIGQMVAMQQQHGQTPPGAQPQPAQHHQGNGLDDYLKGRYGADKLAGFNERFGEGFVDDILKPLAEPVYQVEQQYRQQEQAAIGQEVSTFFKGLNAEYAELYGNGDMTKLSDGQRVARQEVYQAADWIRSGAEMSGVQLSVSDALEYAVAQHSAPHLALLERKRLTASLTKRSNQRTIRPTQRKTQAEPADQPRSIESAMAAYSERAGQLGYDVGDSGV